MDTEGAPIGDPTVPDTTPELVDPISTEPESTDKEPLIDTPAEAEEPEPTTTDEKDSSDTDTSSTEDKATKEAREKKEAQEKKETLDREVNQLGETIENTTAQTFVDQLNEPGADQDQLMSENQGKQLLRTRFLVKTTRELGKGKELRLTSDLTGASARYRTADGKAILLVKAIDSTTDSMTCTVMGPSGPEEKSIPRTELLDLMMETDEAEILTAFTPREQELMRKYFATKRDEEKGDDYYDTLPALVTEVAESNGIVTTGTLIRAATNHYKPRVAAAGASAEDVQRINEENEQDRQRLEEIKDQLKDRNLANANDIDQIMSIMGLDKESLAQTLAQSREGVLVLQKQINEAKTDDEKDRLKLRLDNLNATIQVYSEIQSKITETTTQEYLDKQQAGNVPPELSKSIAQAIENGEMAALVLMVSPEADINATAEQKTKAREGREKFDKRLKTAGMIAALAALLLALGISQGAKQQ